MAYIYDLADTWADGTTTFNGIRLNVTDTASAAASNLLDLQVGGVSRFRVTKGGVVAFTGVTNPSGGYFTQYGTTGHQFGTFAVLGGMGSFGGNSGINIAANYSLSWSSTNFNPALQPDLQIFRDAANILAQRNGTNAQAFRLYNTFTDASNYERGFMNWASNVLEIGAEAAGTGTLRNIRIPLVDNGNLLIFGGLSVGITFGVDEDGSLLVRRLNSSAFGLCMGSRGGSAGQSLTLGASTTLAFSSANQPDGDATIDAGFFRTAAGVIGIVDGATGGAAMQFKEQTAPAAPAADNVRIYAEDDGAGKTRLMARFATGAAVQIAIEP